MVQIYLIRHGESTVNASGKNESSVDANPALTSKGIQQSILTANHLSEFLRHDHLSIYHSPLDRVIDTFEPFHQLMIQNHQIFIKRDLNEMIEYLPPHKFIDSQLSSKGIKNDGTWLEFVHRVQRFNVHLKHRLVESSDTSKIFVLFGHGLFFGVWLTYIGTQERFVPNSAESVSHRLRNCSISHVEYDVNQKIWKIHYTGCTDHL